MPRFYFLSIMVIVIEVICSSTKEKVVKTIPSHRTPTKATVRRLPHKRRRQESRRIVIKVVSALTLPKVTFLQPETPVVYSRP